MYNNGDAAVNYLAESPNFRGTKMKPATITSQQTARRRRAENSIRQLAKSGGLDKVVTTVLLKSTSELANYVQSKGDTPNRNSFKLAIQAALLRANEVAQVAHTLDIPDAEALQQIENAEQEAIDINSMDSNAILPPDVAGALKLVLDHIADNSPNGDLQSVVVAIKRQQGADSFDFTVGDLLGVPGHSPIGSPSPGGTHLGNVSYPDYYNDDPDHGTDLDDYLATSDTNISPNTTPKKSGLDGILDSIGKIVGAVVTVGGAVQGAAGSVANAGNIITDKASDIGAASINKSLKQNLPYIISGVVLIIIIILLIIYVSKRK